MVQTLSPDTADDPFGKRILKRRPRSRDHLFDPHPFDSVLEIFGIDAVAVAEQIPGSLILGEGIDDLLSCPFSSRICRDIEVNNFPPIVQQDNEAVQNNRAACARSISVRRRN